MIRKFFFVLSIFLLCLTGCASSPKSENESAAVSSVSKSDSESKSLFLDWKYRGFGAELPQWVEAAYKKDAKKLKKIIPEFTDVDLVIGGFAINGDQAEKYIEANKTLDGYIYFDSCWAKVNQEVEETELPYVYLLIFLKNRGV